MRMIAVFRKGESVRFISHLDLQRAMQRALRRADIPVAYSKGFNPHSLLSFASAPPVGMLSVGEIMDIKLDTGNPEVAQGAHDNSSPEVAKGAQDNSSPEVAKGAQHNSSPIINTMLERLNSVLPSGIFLSCACFAPDSAPSPMAVLEGADYELACSWPRETAEKAVAAFLQSGEVIVEKKSKTGIKQVDIRPMVYDLFVEADKKAEAGNKREMGNKAEAGYKADAGNKADAGSKTIIKARVSLCEKATVRPEMLIRALTRATSLDGSCDELSGHGGQSSEPATFDVTRTLLLARKNNRFIPLINVYRESAQ